MLPYIHQNLWTSHWSKMSDIHLVTKKLAVLQGFEIYWDFQTSRKKLKCAHIKFSVALYLHHYNVKDFLQFARPKTMAALIVKWKEFVCLGVWNQNVCDDPFTSIYALIFVIKASRQIFFTLILPTLHVYFNPYNTRLV